MQRRDAMIAIGTGAAAALAGCLSSASEGEDPAASQDETDEDPEGEDESGGDDQEITGDEEPELRGTRLRVTGRGSVETDPNKAEISLAVEATAESAEAVRDQLSEDSDAVREALLDAGLEDDHITTGYFRIRERHRESGYQGIHAYDVEVEDIDRVGEIVDVAVNAGADSVGRIHFTITDERRDELRDQALEEAVEDAREEAETVAETQGMEIVGVEELSTDGHSVSPYTQRLQYAAEDGADGGAPTSIDEGPVTVSASVAVAYVID